LRWSDRGPARRIDDHVALGDLVTVVRGELPGGGHLVVCVLVARHRPDQDAALKGS